MNEQVIVYTSDYVVTQNKCRTVYEKGAIAIKHGKIVAVGAATEVLSLYSDLKRVDLGKSVIMPGLINGHTHIPMSFLRGRADDKPLMNWLQEDIFPIEAKLTPEKIKLASMFSCAEMMRTGTTSLCDMYFHSRFVGEAVHEMGMRGVVGESVIIYPTAAYKNSHEALERARESADFFKNFDRVRFGLMPHAIYTTSPEFLTECLELSQELGVMFGMHLSETSIETCECLKTRGVRPVEYCKNLGILNDQSTFFHMVDVNEDDLILVAESGASIVHNPASNMKLASGVAPVPLMHKLGISVGLGTDGPASNNAQNMVREMYLAALLQKVYHLDATISPAQQSLDMATCGGAKALHWDGLGSLEVGNEADFIALSLSEPNMQPVHNVVSNVVYAASGLENRLTVVGGEVLYQDGKYKRFDYEALCEEMESLRQWTKTH